MPPCSFSREVAPPGRLAFPGAAKDRYDQETRHGWAAVNNASARGVTRDLAHSPIRSHFSGYRPRFVLSFRRSVVRECPVMSNACSSCQTQESTSAGKWVVRADCVGRRSPPNAICDSRVHYGFPAGLCAPGAPAPFRCRVFCVLDAATRRETAIDDFKKRRNPTLVCRDISMVLPWAVELR